MEVCEIGQNRKICGIECEYELQWVGGIGDVCEI